MELIKNHYLCDIVNDNLTVMKRILSLLFVFATLSVVANAHEISSEESLQKALSVMHNNKSYAKAMGKNIAFNLVATEQASGSKKSLFYVFENTHGGFIITGADHRAHALLGYVDEGSYDDAMQVPGFQNWLAECKAMMTWLSEQNDGDMEKVHIFEGNVPDKMFTSKDGETLTVAGRHYAPKASQPESVLPLLENIKWNQTAPFNGQCPVLSYGSQCVTGCVATATAQIMKFYEWPQRGTGSNSYTTSTYGFNLSKDFSQSTYDWANMLDDYNGSYTQTQGNAVAKLMNDVGIAVNMNYGPSSGASETMVPSALSNNFGYDKSMKLCYREYFTAAEWNDLLKDEIASGRPILMCGTNYYEFVGHAFVLDGYNSEGLYHVNWGWGGVSNGYFDINYMNPEVQGAGGSNGGYPADQSVVIGATPDVDGTSVGISDLYVSHTINYDYNGLTYAITNYGQKPFNGQLGFAAVKNNEILKTILLDVSDMKYSEAKMLQCDPKEFGFTVADVQDEYIYIYPIANDNGHLYVPTSQVGYPSYRVLFDNGGNLAVSYHMEDMAQLSCKDLQVLRAYEGYDVKVKATIANDEECPVYDRLLGCYVYDSNGNYVATSYNFKYINPGESEEIEFSVPSENLHKGEIYTVLILRETFGGYLDIIYDANTQLTLQSTGGQPNITYSDFEISKQSIARGETLTASMKATNTGGFFVGEYYCFVFSAEGGSSLMRMPVVEADVANGSVVISTKAAIDLEPGEYMTVFYLLENGALTQVQTYDYCVFTVTNVLTDIDMVTEHGAAKAEYYDIMGRKVTGALKKGIYISNGKKVLR